MTKSYEFTFLTSGDDRLARYRDEADHARLAALLPSRAGLLSRLVTRPARQRKATVAGAAPATGRTTADARASSTPAAKAATSAAGSITADAREAKAPAAGRVAADAGAGAPRVPVRS